MSDAASAIENIVIYQMKLYVFLKQETIALDAAVNEPERCRQDLDLLTKAKIPPNPAAAPAE